MKKLCIGVVGVLVFLTCSCANNSTINEEQVAKSSEKTLVIQSEEINQENTAAEVFFVNWEQTVEEFEMSNSSGIIKNILDLAWLAPRNGLNIEEISGNATEKNNAYILESNTVVNDEEKRNENYTDNIWLRIVRYPVEKDVGTSILEYKDILIYAEGEDAYIAMQSLENTELWTLWKIPTYGDWLYKEIALFMRIRTGL